MRLIAAIFLGWGLGANDAANVFGTAVSSHMVRWRTAATLIAVAVMAGAVLEGGNGLDTLGTLQQQSLNSAFCVSLAAALTVALMTGLKIPVSTSQAVVGGIIGVGLARGTGSFTGLGKIVVCWIGTPVGALLLAVLLYPLLTALFRRLKPHFLVYDALMRTLLVLGGLYGAYALGANNVANVTGVFYKAGVFGGETPEAATWALVVGGASIGMGALTFSRKVMNTVGSKIVRLDAFTAFVVILSEAVTVHIYALIGVPVSTSQAVVGAVIGIGVLKGLRTISGKTVLWIAIGWLMTPVLGTLLGFCFSRFF